MKSSFVFSYFRRKEKKLYKIADSIGCMSQKNIDYIHEHNPKIDIEKLHILSNWTRVKENLSNPPKTESNYDFKDKFVAVFGGNFGLPQKIEFLIEVAEKLRERKDILFYLVGEGTEMGKDKNLQNVSINCQMPREEYLDLLKNCHVGLVNLSDKFTIPNIPSRTLSYWSLKLPVLAAVDKSTDYGRLLEECNGGLWSITGDTNAYISNLLLLLNNPEKRIQMGKNGFNYLVSKLNSETAYKKIISVI